MVASVVYSPNMPMTAPQTVPQSPAQQTVRPQEGTQYRQDMAQTAPPESAQSTGTGSKWLTRPIESYRIASQLKANPSPAESTELREARYRALEDALSPVGKARLYNQLKAGRLTDTRSDDSRSALAHLHAILTKPRANGIDARTVLEETLQLMDAPHIETQKFGASLSEKTLRRMMDFYRGPHGPKIKDAIDWNQVRDAHSSVCPAASQMFDTIQKSPAEFARHIAELTSPKLAFWEHALSAEISAEDPAKATQILQESKIPYQAVPGSNGSQYWVKVGLPYGGLLRAIEHQGQHSADSRGLVESMYQDAMVRLVEPTYDPGLAMCINEDGTLKPFDGLIAEQTGLLQSIIRDNGGVIPVPYMFALEGADKEPYLLGYYRQPQVLGPRDRNKTSFDQTADDLVQAIRDYKSNILVGIVDTDAGSTSGRLNMKHEFTITDYRYDIDPKTGRDNLVFIVKDTDDGREELVEWPAKRLVPMLHHAQLPAKQALRIMQEMKRLPDDQYLIPDDKDGERFRLIRTVPTEQQQGFIADFDKRNPPTAPAPQAQAPQQPAAPQRPAATPYMSYPGVYMMPVYAAPQPYATVPSSYYPTYNTAAYAYPTYRQPQANPFTQAYPAYTYNTGYNYSTQPQAARYHNYSVAA